MDAIEVKDGTERSFAVAAAFELAGARLLLLHEDGRTRSLLGTWTGRTLALTLGAETERKLLSIGPPDGTELELRCEGKLLAAAAGFRLEAAAAGLELRALPSGELLCQRRLGDHWRSTAGNDTGRQLPAQLLLAAAGFQLAVGAFETARSRSSALAAAC